MNERTGKDCRMKIRVQLFTTLLLATGQAAADYEPVVLKNTEVRQLRAESNGVPYSLYVSLPDGYGETSERYPVVYMLDADYSFAIAHNVVSHLVERKHLRPLILVAVAYGGPLQYRMNRTRDYTPTHSLKGGYGPEFQKVSGGGPRFRHFLEKELIPFIDGEYRTLQGERALTGHSYGALFASWVYLTRPDLFNRYLIVSPSLWYDEGMIFALEKELRERKPEVESDLRRVYLAVGADEARVMSIDLLRLVERLEERSDPQLKLYHEILPDETHNSVFPSAFSRGLRWAFEGR